MKNIIKLFISILIFLLSSSVFAWKWLDLWQTPDQQGAKLLQGGKPKEASQLFVNKDWRGVSLYRSNQYSQAFQEFKKKQTSDNQYNAGNAAAFLGQYEEAIKLYDKAIALNAKNSDAVFNRELIKKLLNKKNQSQNNSSANNNKEQKKNTKDQAKNDSSSQHPEQHNSSSHKNDGQQNAQNNQPKEPGKEPSQQTQADNSQQKNKKNLKPNKQQTETASSNGQSQPQNEEKKQLLRRLADEPGGLLHQKFMRDYYRRHTVSDNLDPGEN